MKVSIEETIPERYVGEYPFIIIRGKSSDSVEMEAIKNDIEYMISTTRGIEKRSPYYWENKGK